jgi:hypothetical protein
MGGTGLDMGECLILKIVDYDVMILSRHFMQFLNLVL